MPWQLYHQEKRPWYPLDRKLGGPQSQSGHSGEEKKSLPLPGIKPQSSSLKPSILTDSDPRRKVG